MTKLIRVISKELLADKDFEGSTINLILNLNGATEEQLQHWLRDNYPETHCQHAHDCCGNFYAKKARVTSITGNTARVTQRAYRNI